MLLKSDPVVRHRKGSLIGIANVIRIFWDQYTEDGSGEHAA
jgi:hypothetical protein